MNPRHVRNRFFSGLVVGCAISLPLWVVIVLSIDAIVGCVQ